MEQKLPFKQSMSRLEEIIAALEKNEIELEDAIALFEEGLQLVNSCDSQLKNFENRVQELLNTYQEGMLLHQFVYRTTGTNHYHYLARNGYRLHKTSYIRISLLYIAVSLNADAG